MDEIRKRLLTMSEAASKGDDPLSWFEELYSSANRDEGWIPWSDGRPNPLVVEWVIRKSTTGRALVVGCGLGEDAVFLEQRGWDVTAFDLSATAVEWAKEQHPNSKIEWLVADLLNLPEEWGESFDLVLEVHIIQALPESIRILAASRLSPLVSSGGCLVCIGRYQTGREVEEGPPWPLPRLFIESIGENLEMDEFEISSLPDDEPEVSRFRAVWRA
ncbi:MAG: class I SAM-dependent methyltransferase [Candidatus Thermoplasmatota archaeon]|nr:class I SAM-dependent methyltransferase [Candidatus Thermoplasmatota archaeon]